MSPVRRDTRRRTSWVVTDPHGTSLTDIVGGPGGIAIILVVAISAGYGSVLVRAIRSQWSFAWETAMDGQDR